MLFAFLALPIQAKAGFFSSTLGGDKAYADTPIFNQNNSQTMALLQANVSSIPIFQDKNIKKDLSAQAGGKIDEKATINIVSDNALLPTATPQSVSSSGTSTGGNFYEGEIEIYVVRQGDTVETVAKLFEVSTDTILSANDMKKGDKLKEGDVLLILPFSGVEHTVVKGETIQNIANKYKVDLEDILNANDLDANATIAVGEKLIIPGAEISEGVIKVKPKTVNGLTVAKKGGSKASISLQNVDGYFKKPVLGAIRTRGVSSGHRGADLAAPAGTPIYAPAAGKVMKANPGYNGGFGNMTIIQHSNGCKTLYAHQSKLATQTGAQVSQGEIIGYVGNTGRSRGNHLHIETIGCKNPF